MKEPIDFAIDPPGSAAAALADWLAAPPPGHTAWLLVDASSYGPGTLAGLAKELGWTLQSAFGLRPLAVYGEHAPHLIALTPKDGALADRLARLVQGRLVPAFSGFVSSASIDDLRALFTYLGHAHIDEDPLYCRFADTRVLPALLEVLIPAQSSRLTSIITEWRWVNHRGTLDSWPRTTAASGLPSADHGDQQRSIALSAAQYSHMLRAAEPDVMFAQLTDAVPSIVPATERGAFRDRIGEALDAADAREVDGNPDRLQFLTLALTCGDDFHEHPLLQDTWRAVHSGETTLSAAMQLWDSALWSALKDKGAKA